MGWKGSKRRSQRAERMVFAEVKSKRVLYGNCMSRQHRASTAKRLSCSTIPRKDSHDAG